MRISVTLFFVGVVFWNFAVAQAGESPNYANSASLPPSAAQASKMNSTPVNLFTGVPAISVPIYNFKNNSGIGISVSVEYSGGGIQVGESPSIVGLGWYLNTGGMITRTVRGMPDDMPTYGFLYSANIPADWRTNAKKYFQDSLDAQQDIFQYNFPGHSGKFFIGRDSQVIVVPFSKIKVIPAFWPATLYNQTLKSFRIVSEDGVKYDFEDADHTTIGIDNSYPNITPSGYYGKAHATSWYLTRIISAFSTDTIKFNYEARNISYGFKLPQVTFVNNSTGARTNPGNTPGFGNSQAHKITSIELPDKTTVSFVYSHGTKYNGEDYALSKIKISDTAFRFGYLLDYDSVFTFTSSDYGHPEHNVDRPIKLLLKSITPFTKTEKQNGYQFFYATPYFPKVGSYGDSLYNKVDHWGFYNGAYNGDSLIPKVNSYTWGAYREPSGHAVSGMLSRFRLPTGGSITYGYELNDHYPNTTQNNSVAVSLHTSTNNNITLDQVFSSAHLLTFKLDKTVNRTGASPVSGTGTMNVTIKNTAGTVTYASTTISLNELFYSGMKSWIVNLANGTYRIETSLTGGTSISGSLPANLNWQNKTYDNTVNYNLAGGLRVSTISRENGQATGVIEVYKYITADGKSSGFMGDIPKYDYPFSTVYTNGSTDFTVVSSEPQAVPASAQGGIAGYSRVEVTKEFMGSTLGKEIHEFTDFRDMNTNYFVNAFPYTPQDVRTWGLGMPKRVSLYDSLGVLVKRTVNTFQYDSIVYQNDNFKSLKTGHSQNNNSGTTGSPGTSSKGYIGEVYYLSNGRSYMTSSRDTLFQTNGSINTSFQLLFYDTYYNVNKVIAGYDRTRGLQKETRMYYPYNYTVGGGIGKLRDSSIISQVVGTETWITDEVGANGKITGGAMTSFRQIGSGDLKPDTIYSFESNKPVPLATIGAFDASKLNRNTTYFKPQSYFTSYDSKGNLSEVKSLVTNLSNSVITDYDQQYVVAKASNTVQADMAYTSFESIGSGNWTIGSSTRDATQSLTGKRSYNLSNGNVSKAGLSSSQAYLLTIWVKSGASVSVNSTALSNSIATQISWNLYSVTLNGITSVTISGSGAIDEVRLHPKDANMETNTYEPLVGVTSAADANNTIVYTEYDKQNRVKLIRDKDKNIIKRLDYSDTTMVVNMSPLWQGFEKRCSPTYPGQVDSAYRDMNIFSDSSGYVKWVYQGYLDCSCAGVSSLPQYKVINGACEIGTWTVTASVYKKVLVDGFLQFRWVCTHRYCFSDGSTSTYFEETIHTSSCGITCYQPI